MILLRQLNDKRPINNNTE